MDEKRKQLFRNKIPQAWPLFLIAIRVCFSYWHVSSSFLAHQSLTVPDFLMLEASKQQTKQASEKPKAVAGPDLGI